MKESKMELLLDALWAAKVRRDIGVCNTDKMDKHIAFLIREIKKEKQKEQNNDV